MYSKFSIICDNCKCPNNFFLKGDYKRVSFNRDNKKCGVCGVNLGTLKFVEYTNNDEVMKKE